MSHIKNASALLSDIAYGIAKLEATSARLPLSCIEVSFECPRRKRYKFTLSQAIQAVADDIYWDERGDWSNATKATVQVL